MSVSHDKRTISCTGSPRSDRNTGLPWYRTNPQIFFRTTNVTGKTHVIGDVQMAMPGDGVQLQVNLLQPIALTTGDHFAIREGGKTVGSGVVTEITA